MQDPARLVPLLPSQARDLDALLASGRFGSESDILGQALRLLREQAEEVERWLKNDVLPVVDAMTKDPGRGIPIDEVAQALRDVHRRRTAEAPHA